jgi:hypothetical protein
MDHPLIPEFEVQAVGCELLGSPFYASLLRQMVEELRTGGPTQDVLAGHEGSRGSDVITLRLLGTVHGMVLAGTEPELARHYPSVGGDGDPIAAWPRFQDLLRRRPDDVRAGFASAPQTNEVGRAASLVAALSLVAATHPHPIRLHEVGTSAGLNLRFDRYAYEIAPGRWWGPDRSPVRFVDAWHGEPPAFPDRLELAERVGCDLRPVDATTEEGQRRLLSYVWPDDEVRLARLRGALAVAPEVEVELVAGSASEHLRGLAPEPQRTLVIWHSVVRQYFTRAERDAVDAELQRLAAAATVDAPVAHLSLEPAGTTGVDAITFRVSVRMWPGDVDRVIALAGPHAPPVRFTGG